MAKKAETKTVVELKKELQRVMEALMENDDDDYNLEVTDNAIQTLCALKDLKLKQTDQEFLKLKNLDFQEPPPEFRCPISGILMKDPVVLASGQVGLGSLLFHFEFFSFFLFFLGIFLFDLGFTRNVD